MNTKLFSVDDTSKDKKTSSWFRKTFLSSIPRMFVLGTSTSLAATALVGYFGIIGVLPAVQQYMESLPVTQRMLDYVQDMRVKPMLPGKFNVLVADLDGDLRDGRNTAHVINTLADQFDVSSQTSPIRVQRTRRVLRLPPAPDTATANKLVIDKGRKQLEKFNANLMVWGVVARGLGNNVVLRLRFLHRASGQQKSQTGSYALGQTLELPARFGSDLGAALAAQVAADAAPASDSGHHVVALLEPVLIRLRALTKRMPVTLTPDQRGGILSSYAKVAKTIGDQKGDKDLFSESFRAYRLALKEWPKDKNPTKWAMTHQNLGDALGDLARIESGMALIEESISSQRNALSVFNREDEPYRWARAQHSLCIALRRLALRETGITSAKKSEVACRAAMEVVALENRPASLAPIQGNLGAALILVGRRGEGTKQFEEGIYHLRAALNVITREVKPLWWARGKHDIGIALLDLGKRQNSIERLQESVIYLQAALEELTLEKVPTYWTAARVSLSEVLIEIGSRESHTIRLKEAIDILREILVVGSLKVPPTIRSSAQSSLARALLIIGRRDNGPDRNSRFAEALRLIEQYASTKEQEEIQIHGRPGKSTAKQLGVLSWYAIHAGAFERAVEVSERAMTLGPEEPWMKVFRAHSYMFTGKNIEAKTLYLSLYDLQDDAKPGQRNIRNDFNTFRQIGLTNPVMVEIETAFANKNESNSSGQTR